MFPWVQRIDVRHMPSRIAVTLLLRLELVRIAPAPPSKVGSLIGTARPARQTSD